MPAYKLVVRPGVLKDVKSIPKATLLKLRSAMRTLADEPFARGTSKLQGTEDTFRIRVGDYRIIFDIDSNEKIVTIIHVAHRRDVYRKY